MSNTEYFVELIRKCLYSFLFLSLRSAANIERACARWGMCVLSIGCGYNNNSDRYATSIEDRVSFYCERM